MTRLLFITLFIFQVFYSPANAQSVFTKPAGVPTIHVDDYNVTIGVWAANTGVGEIVGVFELQGGVWYGCSGCSTAPAYAGLTPQVAAAGGPEAFVRTVAVPAINAILAKRYPPIVSGGSVPIANGTTLEKITFAIYQAFNLTAPDNQSPSFVGK